MASPSVAARALTNGVVASPSGNANVASGISAGDFLLLFVSCPGTNTTISTPSGWSERYTVINTGSGRQSCFYKWATGSEGSTVSITFGTTATFSAVSLRITGAHTSTAPESATATGFGVPDSPNLAPAGGSKDYLFAAACAYFSGISQASAPTNYSNLQNAGPPGSYRMVTAERALTGSSDNPAAWPTNAGVNWTAATVAVYPAPEFRDAAVTIALTSTVAVAANLAAYANAAVSIALQSTIAVAVGAATVVNAAVSIAMTSTMAVAAGVATFVDAAVTIALQSTFAVSARRLFAFVSRSAKWILVGTWVDPDGKTVRNRWREL